MPGLGTVINVGCIVAGGLVGLLGGRLLTERVRDGLLKACGLCVLFVGMSGALEKMLVVGDGGLTALAVLVSPLMTPGALTNLSLVGSMLVFCVGVNLIRPGTFRPAGMLPSVVVAAALAFVM